MSQKMSREEFREYLEQLPVELGRLFKRILMLVIALKYAEDYYKWSDDYTFDVIKQLALFTYQIAKQDNEYDREKIEEVLDILDFDGAFNHFKEMAGGYSNLDVMGMLFIRMYRDLYNPVIFGTVVEHFDMLKKQIPYMITDSEKVVEEFVVDNDDEIIKDALVVVKLAEMIERKITSK